jgi:hypothetical protein
MQARAEKSPIYQNESLSDMAKKGESSFSTSRLSSPFRLVEYWAKADNRPILL